MYIMRFADIFYKLTKTRFYIARQELFGKIINLYVWVLCSLVVIGYVMQAFGLMADYGCFQLATVIGTVGLFEVYGNALRTIVDLEGERHIGYYLTLPASPSVVLLSMVSSYVIMGIILSMIVLPFGAAILFHKFCLTDVAWVKFGIILVMANIFYGTFTIAVTSHVGALSRMENIWSRFIFPLWYMGGFQFSWESIYNLSQPLAYILLCNPVLYIMEGTRAAMLGQEGCLPWEICCIALGGFTIICWLYAKYKMKRLLDFV